MTATPVTPTRPPGTVADAPPGLWTLPAGTTIPTRAGTWHPDPTANLAIGRLTR